MNGIGNNSFVTSSPFQTPESMPSAPPPPAEVKVRTLKSDLESMAKSGGGAPRFQNVKVTGLAIDKPQEEGGAVQAKGKSHAVSILITMAIIAALGVIGYFAYAAFLAPGASSGTPGVEAIPGQLPTTQTQLIASSSPTSTNAVVPAGPFVHASLFIKPADQVLTMNLSSGGSASSALDLQTFNQKLLTLLAGANKTATLIEIDVKGADGNDMSVSNILAQMNAQILDPALLTDHFNPDTTFFVFRDKNGFWPGFVIAINPGENWLFLKSDVQKLETSPSTANMYLQNPGNQSEGGFTDSSISNTTVRILPFQSATASNYFIYGWFETHLILSTSQNGFAEAVGRL